MLEVSDKVVLMRAIKSVECFRPVPEVRRVYCVREVVDDGLKLTGIVGVREEGEEVTLAADLFRRLVDVQRDNARRDRTRRRRKKGGA